MWMQLEPIYLNQQSDARANVMGLHEWSSHPRKSRGSNTLYHVAILH
jgi:hypothetical protein